MRIAPFLISIFTSVFALPALAAELTDKSLSPEWGRASDDEKARWLAKMRTTLPDTASEDLGRCLNEHSGWPALETNLLPGVSSMCATIIEREK